MFANSPYRHKYRIASEIGKDVLHYETPNPILVLTYCYGTSRPFAKNALERGTTMLLAKVETGFRTILNSQAGL